MYQQTLVGGWGTMVAGVFDYKDQYEGNDSCRSNWIMIITSCYAWNFLKKQNRYFELFSNAFSQSKARPAYIAEMKAKLGDEEWIKISAKRSTMTFPNQTEFGLDFSGRWQWSSNCSKPIWITFWICVLQNNFLSDPGPIIVYPCQSLTHWLTNWLTTLLKT